jgi:hypothetical protein
MPRPRQTGIERHGRRFRLTWWVDGQRNRRTFDTEDAAAAFMVRMHKERQGIARATRLAGSLTVREVVDNWYRDHRRNLSPGTQRDYEGRIRRDVTRIGERSAEALARNPRELRAFYATLTPTTARRLHAILRRALCKGLHGPTEIKLPKTGRQRTLILG